MPESKASQEEERRGETRTLSEIMLRLKTPKERRELEEFRIKHEAAHGEADITRRWTSTLPDADQDYLLTHHPKRYWDGLPPFAQAFLREKMRSVHRQGKLDDMPDEFLSLYLNRQMTVAGEDGHNR